MSLLLPDPDDPRNKIDDGFVAGKRSDHGIHVPANGGLQRWFAGDAYSVKLTTEATGGSIGVVQGTVPPGGGPVPHVHHGQEETFYVLQGELEFLEGEREFTAQTGDIVHIPRGVRHRFRNVGYHSAQLLFIYTPGGTEGMFVEAGEEARPGVSVTPFDPEIYQAEFIQDLYVKYNGDLAL